MTATSSRLRNYASNRRRSQLRADVIELFQARLADEEDLRALDVGTPAAYAHATSSGLPGRVRKTAHVPGNASRQHQGQGERGLVLVLGESPTDKRAIAYVARLLGRRRGFRVCLAYVLPQFPSNLLEHGGAGDPEAEERLSATLRADRRLWIAARKREAQSLIEWASTSLRNAGLPSRALETRFCGPVSESAIADEILRLASRKRYRTVVVGRHERSWLRSLFGRDLRRELARRDSRTAIWGIG